MATVKVEAPMAGSVKELLVSVGDAVGKEQELLIIESMKMEIPIESPSAGTVTEICVSPGQAIEEGTLLLLLEA